MKAQAAMEYLMTYGWALLVIVIVLGSLFYLGVFNPQTSVQDSCSIPGEISCEIMGLSEDGELIIKLTNLQPAQLSNVQIEWVSDEEVSYASSSQSLNIGETKVFTLATEEKGAIGTSKQGKIQVSYSTGTSDLKKTLTGTILAVYSIPSIHEGPYDELILDGNETETENGNETETDEEDDELHLGDNNQTGSETNETEEAKCILGEYYNETRVKGMQGNTQNVLITWAEVEGEGCGDKVMVRMESTFDNPLQYQVYNDRQTIISPSGNEVLLQEVRSRGIDTSLESAYSSNLKIGESLLLEDGKELVVEDIFIEDGVNRVRMTLKSAQGLTIHQSTYYEDIFHFTGKEISFKIYEIKADDTLENMYIRIAIIEDHEYYLNGWYGPVYSSGWKSTGTLTYEETTNGITGFTLELNPVYTGESGPEEPDPEPIPDCVSLGSGIETSSHMVSEVGAIQNIEKTYGYYEGELCPETKHLFSSESRFDSPLPYNENIFKIKEQKDRLNLNEIFDLKLYDGTTIELNEMIDNSSVRIIIRDFEGLEIMNTIVSEGNNNINTGMKQYVLEIDEVHNLGNYVNESYIEGIRVVEEVKGHKYRKEIKFEDESWFLGYFDSNTLTLYKESQYSPDLMIGETLDLGDGNKLVLVDVMDTSYGVQEARLEIRNAQGETVSIMNQERGITEYNIGSLKYKIMLYDISTSPKLNPYDMYVKVGIISEEVIYKQGIIEESEENDVIRKTKLNIYTSGTGLEGFKLDYETMFLN
jgi:hypothetical protein